MILLYHKVATEKLSDWWVTADSFDKQMAALSAYQVVHLSEYDSKNEKHAVITFDGVYENVFLYALPLLKKWGYKFELFITGKYIDQGNEFDASEPYAKFCSIAQLEVMAQHGGHVQWHTSTHASMSQLDETSILQEITVPAHLRLKFASPHFDWFAYPHGDHSEFAVDAVKTSFKGALSCNAGNDEDPYQLNRITVIESTRLEKTKVTVIVANYNYGVFLPEAMESVLRQSIAPHEIILIDDCSTDNSKEIALRYVNVAQVVINNENLGIVANFNKAVNLAKGDYIAFLGADNRMRADYVEKCKVLLDSNADTAIAYTDMVIFGSRSRQLAESVGAIEIGKSESERWPIFYWSFPEPTPEALSNLRERNFMHGSSMYRKSAFNDVGGYVSSNGPEDHNLFLRILHEGWLAKRISHPLVEYRQHSNSQANTFLGLQLELAHQRAEVARYQTLLTHQLSVKVKLEEKIEASHISADTRINEIQNTLSWRITKPLRFLRALSKGDWAIAISMLKNLLRSIWIRLPNFLKSIIRKIRNISLKWEIAFNSTNNSPAIRNLTAFRSDLQFGVPTTYHQHSVEISALPTIDISIVTFNSYLWIEKFIQSLVRLNYPKHLLFVRFVDNNSTDNTTASLISSCEYLNSLGLHAELIQRPNLGFGAGHNASIFAGIATFCLVTNIDLEFEPNSLAIVANLATKDNAKIAAWELRQKPYEHPKYYDPVTLLTNWNSHACVLLRRSAIQAAGGYDTNLFMYCEDVELSYRLRRAGYLLRYCPKAVVFHYTYENENTIKPLQFAGSTLGNFYLRLKYGTLLDTMAGVVLLCALLFRKSAFSGAKKIALKNILKAFKLVPKALLGRKAHSAAFSFRGFDYEIARQGAFFNNNSLKADQPLVSVITRTYTGRQIYLAQALQSVANQTYLAVEHIVVEDGGSSMESVTTKFKLATGANIKFFPLSKLGRSAAGNAGLEAAQGKYCLFLDDDDLLFSDHIETLVNTLEASDNSAAAYSTAMEVITSYDENIAGGYTEHSWNTHPIADPKFSYDELNRRNLMAIQSVLFKRNLYEKNGGFETELDALEDWNLWLRYAWKNDFIYIPKLTSLYRTPSSEKVIRQRERAFITAYTHARKLAAKRNNPNL